MGPQSKQCSTSIILNSEASPKAISERTSYLQVRLEFLRYPHLIPALFNVRGFGPPVRFTAPSTWTWVDHMVSGLRLHTQTPYSDSLSLRLRLFDLTSHAIVTRRFILQKARHHPLTGFDLLQAHGFRFYFTPLPGCFSPFPHGTGSLSVTREYLALGDGPPGFRRNFSCSAVLRILLGVFHISSTGFLPSLTDFSKSFDYLKELPYWSPTTPMSKLIGLGFSRFARRYSGNRIFFLFLQVLRCFSSLRLPRMCYVFTQS